jgi:TRAP-type C4-dicarboxylate transport system permease small subunit
VRPARARWWGIADLLGGVLLLVMSMLVVLSVIGRSLPSLRLPNADQMLPDMLVWVAMLGTAAAVRRNEHLGISLLTDRLPAGARRALGILVLAAAAVFFVSLLIRGSIAFRNDFDAGLSGPAGYPYWLVTLALPVGAFLSLAYLAVRAYWLARGVEDRPDTAEAAL